MSKVHQENFSRRIRQIKEDIFTAEKIACIEESNVKYSNYQKVCIAETLLLNMLKKYCGRDIDSPWQNWLNTNGTINNELSGQQKLLNSYEFMLDMTDVAKEYGDKIHWSIYQVVLKNMDVEQSPIIEKLLYICNFILSIYYTYNIHDKNNAENLKFLRSFFTDNNKRINVKHCPLAYEVYSRINGNEGNYREQYWSARVAYHQLDQAGIKNIALLAAKISAVCDSWHYYYLNEVKKGKKTMFTLVNQTNALSLFPYKENKEDQLKDSTIIQEAFNDVKTLIESNPNYAKYYYFRAELALINYMWQAKNGAKWDLESENETRKNIYKDVKHAKEIETNKSPDRLNLYDNVINMFEYIAMTRQTRTSVWDVEKMKEKVCALKSCPPVSERPSFLDAGENFIFISYASVDFKSVYCDIIELEQLGVSIKYDKDLSYGHTWREVNEIIAKSSAVFCYLSANSIFNANVQEELHYAKKIGKPIYFIDIAGKRNITGSMIDSIRNGSVTNLSKVNSDKIRKILDLTDDEITIISKDNSPRSIQHIKAIWDIIYRTVPQCILQINVDHATTRSNKYLSNGLEKPCEDIVDVEEQGLFFVMDGITRMKDPSYTENKSQSKSVGEIFIKGFKERFRNTANIAEDIHQVIKVFSMAFDEGIKSVRNHFKQESYIRFDGNVEPAGCVGIIGLIYKDYFVFANIGDCQGILLRDGKRMIFADSQTEGAFSSKERECDREGLYKNHVNNIQSEFGYGVINGDNRARDFFNVSYFKYRVGDTIFLVTDGIAPYVRYLGGDLSALISEPAEKLCQNAAEYERKRTALEKVAIDDMGIVRINIVAGVESTAADEYKIAN